jgi:hypothetical protein
MRKAIVLLAVVLAILCTFAASKLRSSVSATAPELGQKIAAKLGVRVEIGDVDTKYFPPSAEIRDVRVSALRRNVQPFLVIDKVRIEPAWLPLLAGKFEVRAVTAKRPTFQSIRHGRDGSLATYLPDGWWQKLALEPFSIRVRDGTVLLEDRTVDPPETSLRVVALAGTVKGGSDRVLHIELSGAPLGAGSSGRVALRLEPGVGPTGGDVLEIELDVHRGSAAALRGAFASLRDVDLHDPVQLSLRAKGYFGEKSTESEPAQPLLGTLRGSTGLKIEGRDERLELDLAVALDDSRYQVRGGKGSWGGFRFQGTGWLTRNQPHKLSAKLDFEPFAVEDTAASFGAPARWRPHGRAEQVVMRVLGPPEEPLIRYEMRVPTLTFPAWAPRLLLEAGPVDVRGSLLAVNTDISASFDSKNLRVGTVHTDSIVFGISYWRDKITVSALDSPQYGGRFDGSLAVFPKVSSDLAAGGMLRDGDAATVLANAIPSLGVQIGGRFDGSAQLSSGDDGESLRGRVGIHRGRLAGANWMRELLSAAFSAAGESAALDDFSKSRRTVMGVDATQFDRMAVDFETRGGPVTLARVVLDLDGGQLRGRGVIGADGSVSLDAALWPDAELAKALLATSETFGRARDRTGRMVLPCSVRVASNVSTIALTPDAAAVLAPGEPDDRVLTPVEVKPAAFPDLPRLRQQFGR